jgi:methylated-DNA-protein-cysteine methyltransferase related protein
MKAHSPFFARIQAQVLAVVRTIPKGKVVTFADIGAHLDVMPRHVAYLLAKLTPEEQALLPWYRAVPAKGSPKSGVSLLEAEGVCITNDGVSAASIVSVAQLKHGIPQQGRPPDAPLAAERPRRRR